MPTSLFRHTANSKIDDIAHRLTPDKYKNLNPLSTNGNGDCFFNSLSLVLFGDGEHSLELRTRTVMELTLNEPFYIQDNNIEKILSKDDSFNSSIGDISLFQYLIDTSVEKWCMTTRESYRTEVMESMKQYRDSTLLYFLGIPSALKCELKSVRPSSFNNVGVNEAIHNATFYPRPNIDRCTVIPETVIIMWTCINNKSLMDKRLNHFVPLVKLNGLEQGIDQRPLQNEINPDGQANKSRKQQKITNHFLPTSVSEVIIIF